MTRRFVQPRIWIGRFATVSNELNRQLVELQRGIVEAISSVATVTDGVTGKNLGAGARVFASRLNQFLRFRTILGTGSVTVAENADGQTVDISADETTSFDLQWTSGAIGSTAFTIDDTEDELLVSKTSLDVGGFWRTVYPRMARGGWIRAERLGTPTDNLQVKVSRVREELDHLAFPIIAGDGSTTASLTLMSESIGEFAIGEFASGSSQTVEVTEEPSSTSLTNGAEYRVQFIPQAPVYETALTPNSAYVNGLDGFIDIGSYLPPNGVGVIVVSASWGVREPTIAGSELTERSHSAVAYGRIVMDDGDLVSVWSLHYMASGSEVIEQHVMSPLNNPSTDTPWELQLLVSDGLLLVRVYPPAAGINLYVTEDDGGHATCRVQDFMTRKAAAA